MTPKYFEKSQALIVFYAVQQAIHTGAKYIYITDENEILAYKEPPHPKEMEMINAQLALTL